MEFSNATIKYKANIYHDGKVTSRTVITANGERKTLGIMLPGNYRFTTDTEEKIDISVGRCRIRLAANPQDLTYQAGDSFSVPAHTSFEIEVLELVDYLCHFG